MLTRRIDLIRLALSLEKDIPEWERQNILAMDREEIEIYIDYLKGE